MGVLCSERMPPRNMLLKGSLRYIQQLLPTYSSTSYQYILSTHPINTYYQHILSTHPINTYYQNIISTHPINTLSIHHTCPSNRTHLMSCTTSNLTYPINYTLFIYTHIQPQPHHHHHHHSPPFITQCLQQELKPWSIHVTNVNPGFMRTPMILDAATGTLKNFNDAPKEITRQVGPSLYRLVLVRRCDTYDAPNPTSIPYLTITLLTHVVVLLFMLV